jgi:hypothetical protein
VRGGCSTGRKYRRLRSKRRELRLRGRQVFEAFVIGFALGLLILIVATD